ncbi:hypothetical protein LINPERPRIM_LOCUS25478 [Linum perenne]
MSRRDRDTDRERERPSGRDRNDRNSGSRRRRSGFDKEPSPKRSRRDDKPQTEKVVSKSHPDATDLINRSQRDNLKLQDAVPLGAAPSHDSKMESAEGKKEPEKNPNEHQSEDIPSSNPTEVPRSRSYFQHDERRDAGQVGRGYIRRSTTERGWRDSKDGRNERDIKKSTTNHSPKREQKLGAKDDDNSAWRHDRFFKVEDEGCQPLRRRPAFREKKNPAKSENDSNPARESNWSSQIDRRPVSIGERREESNRNHRQVDRSRERFNGYRGVQPPPPPSRQQYAGDRSNYRGGEGFNGEQQNNHQSGTRVEKWKHDLFDEAAAKSPTTRNEDDQIARVEALLAS